MEKAVYDLTPTPAPRNFGALLRSDENVFSQSQRSFAPMVAY
jgi:hypothetical protein